MNDVVLWFLQDFVNRPWAYVFLMLLLIGLGAFILSPIIVNVLAAMDEEGWIKYQKENKLGDFAPFEEEE